MIQLSASTMGPPCTSLLTAKVVLAILPAKDAGTVPATTGGFCFCRTLVAKTAYDVSSNRQQVE